MGASPVAILCILAIYGVFFFLIQDAEATGTEDLDTASDVDQPGGVLDIIKEVIDAVWGFVEKLLGALTFNVDGAPIWVRTPVATMIIGSLSWSIVSLIRGTEG